MQYRKIMVYIITILFVLLAVVCVRMDTRQVQTREDPLSLSFLIETNQNTERISLWYDADGNGYVFLPSCGDLEHTKISWQENGTLYIGGVQMENGGYCGALQVDTAYSARFTGKRNTEDLMITFLQSSNMPSVFVDTRSGDMHYIHALKGNEEPGKLRICLPEGQLALECELRAFGGRGNATWEQEKKPYKMELSQETDILGMGKAKKWILLSNVFDPTHIRNKAVMDTASRMELSYSPQGTWVELYLNGEYAGLYLLCEKNEIHPNRVDLDQTTATLISIEKEDRLWEYGGSQLLTENGIPIRVHYTAQDIPAVQSKLSVLENALLSESGTDPVTGMHWSDLVDLDSWAKKYLIEEVFGNLDAGSISQFFYWEAGGKIYAGPVWDYDITMGNPNNWQLESPQMLFAGRPNLWKPGDSPWFYLLYQKPAFRNRVMELYESQLRPLVVDLLEEGIPNYENQTAIAAGLDQIRWSTAPQNTEVAAMHDYMTRRTAFLDSLWLEEEEYHLVSVYIKEHVMACYAVADGGYMEERPVPGGTDTIFYEAWCDADTDQPFDFSQPVEGDKLMYLKETNLLNPETEDSGGFTLRKAITYLPAAALLTLGLILLAADRGNFRRKRGDIHDQSKISA